MPHCIIDYSTKLTQDITTNELMSQVFTAAVKSELFSTSDIKVRANAFNDYYLGEIAQNNDSQARFIHVCCKILSGRTLLQRQQLAKLIVESLTTLKLNDVSISVEIVDMERESYIKQVN